MTTNINIAIFASGSGTNTKAIIKFFSNHKTIKISLVITNRKTAGVIGIANENNVPVLIINNEELNNKTFLLSKLNGEKINFIVLAGFLQKIPSFLVHEFHEKIINIHPALLPRFGGKGMYGKFVHEAVIASQEKESGITIHYVTEEYDEGNIIFQKSIELDKNETAEGLEKKIHQLEHEYFPKIIKQTIESL